jgi:relaxase-like protein
MRPKIMACHSIAKSLKYNEEKVTQGRAECLAAGNFLKDLSRLDFGDKLHCFKKRMELNERVSTNLHITLNFDPLDKLSNEQMKKIARVYMKEIGFERQPYLVYRHNDAGHPHCHIVTTHVQRDGSPIDLYNIGRNQSEKAKQLIEAEFGLVTAAMKLKMRQQHQQINGMPKIKYGEGSTARSMARVLEHVMENYKYTSLEELNAVLSLYNVHAYRGRADSQLYRNRGLLYRVLDEHGKYIGVPLKASFFDCKPTLDNLEKRFVLHQSEKLQHKERMEAAIRVGIYFNGNNLKRFMQRLSAESSILAVLKRDKKGRCMDVSYVSFQHKCIFNGDELGVQCNRDAIQKIIELDEKRKLEESLNESQVQVQRHRHSLHL